jgi:bifunctional non-homologous end joining protein LigD
VPFGLALNDYVDGDGPVLFVQACAMGLEGIVSKRRSSLYRSGRSPHWLKAKNPESLAARREALADWGRKSQVVSERAPHHHDV